MKTGKLHFVRMPPPETVPIHQEAEELLLLPGLRVDKETSTCRCCACHQMKTTLLVWVPDGIRPGDAPSAVSEMARLNTGNGTWSGWCLDCAQKLSRIPKPWNPARTNWLVRTIRKLVTRT